MKEIPFDSDRKPPMSTLHQWGDPLPWGESPTYLAVTKGAPDRVLPICSHVFWDGELRPFDRRLLDEIYQPTASLPAKPIACWPSRCGPGLRSRDRRS